MNFGAFRRIRKIKKSRWRIQDGHRLRTWRKSYVIWRHQLMLWTSPVPEDQNRPVLNRVKTIQSLSRWFLRMPNRSFRGKINSKSRSRLRYLNLIVIWKSPSFPCLNPVKSGLLGFLGPGRALSNSPSKRTLKLWQWNLYCTICLKMFSLGPQNELILSHVLGIT